MAGVFLDGDGALDVMLDMLAAAINDVGWKCRLFVNNHAPAPADGVSVFTEASYPGYVPQDLAALPTVPTPGTIGVLNFAAVTFPTPTSGGPYAVYGYYLTDGDASIGFGAQLFPTAPVAYAVGGLPIVVAANMTLRDLATP